MPPNTNTNEVTWTWEHSNVIAIYQPSEELHAEVLCEVRKDSEHYKDKSDHEMEECAEYICEAINRRIRGNELPPLSVDPDEPHTP